jgi:hypothetical protein
VIAGRGHPARTHVPVSTRCHVTEETGLGVRVVTIL